MDGYKQAYRHTIEARLHGGDKTAEACIFKARPYENLLHYK